MDRSRHDSTVNHTVGGSLVTSPRRLALPLVALLLALFAGEARADVNSPKVRQLRPEEGPVGAMVICDGVNFTDKRDDIEVTCESIRCIVVQASPERITFVIPVMGLEKGPHPVAIKVKGETCKSSFKVIAFKDKKEEADWREIQRQKDQGVGKWEDPYKQIESFLKVDKFEMAPGESPAVVIEGSTTIPAGLSIGIVFGFANDGEQQFDAPQAADPRRGEERLAHVEGGLRSLHGQAASLAGRYYCMATFDMTKQSARST